MKDAVEKMILMGINLYLYWGALQDMKERTIQNSYLGIGEIAGVIFNIVMIVAGNFSLKNRMLALLPGILFLIMTAITKEKIGHGDGMILWVLGNFLDIEELWYILQGALLLLMIFSVLLLCTKKAFHNCQIPFLPFLWMSQTILWGISYV